jgi:hypothetical protein
VEIVEIVEIGYLVRDSPTDGIVVPFSPSDEGYGIEVSRIRSSESSNMLSMRTVLRSTTANGGSSNREALHTGNLCVLRLGVRNDHGPLIAV